MTRKLAVTFLLAASSVAACNVEDPTDTGSPTEDADALGAAEQAVVCPDVSGTNVSRSLAVTDATTLAKFSFKRTMDQIRSTANAGATGTSASVFKQWMGTYGDTAATGNCTNPSVDPNGYGLICPRTPEAKLATVNPFAADTTLTFQPVAVMNRFDLAPTSGANCGEYRIVYAMTGSTTTISGRGFLIFEAALPNPTPSAGVDACLPVAQFWQGLTADASAASRAAKLEQFYFTGGAVPGFPAVVNAAHYGFRTGTQGARNAGQIRTNFFIDFAQWQLREFKLSRQCTNVQDPATCKLRFDHVPVRSNPAEELFAGTHPKSADFRTSFSSLVPGLLATNLNLIALPTQNQFNEFESVSQDTKVVYKLVEDAAMRTVIQDQLTAAGSTLSVNNVLDRATTQTCGGCHQVSASQALGGGLTWPNSLGFVHVDESRNLSPALTGTFLPHRKAVLESFINDRCTPAGAQAATAALPAGLTLGGSPEGSPN